MAGFSNPDSMYTGNGVVSRGIKKIAGLFGNDGPEANKPIWDFSQPINAIKNWDANNRNMDIMNPGSNTQIAPTTTTAPAKTTPITDISTTFGDVGLPKMGPKDLSKLSTGALPTGNPVRRAPVRNAATKPAATISQPDEEGLRTQPITFPVPQLSAGQRIFEMSGADAAGMAKAGIVDNGGFATMDGRTFVLPSRGVDEESAFKTQQAQTQNTLPITALTQPTIDMSPGSQGEWAANQGLKNRISALSPDLNTMTMADLAAYNKGVKALGVTSQANYRDAAAKNFGDDNALKVAELPSKIYQNNSSGFHNMVAGQMLGITEPAKAANYQAEAIDKLESLPGKKLETNARTRNLISEADTRDFLAPTIATKNLADAAEQQARIKTLLAPAAAKGSLTEKDILDAAHTDAYKTAVELTKGSLVTDPVERQKEFDRNYLNAKKSALVTIQQMRAGSK